MKTKPAATPAVRWITETLEEAGHETWAVGGAVRNSLLGRPAGDWDFATHARPEQVRKIFRRTVPIGIDHGTVGVLSRDGTLYEVTTFRRDVETDGRHAVVAFAETLEEDLARRDFTINAIAWHPLREELFDPFDGAGDLERGVLTTVGSAEERFREDYLRILRALRFAGYFALEIARDTWTSARDLVEHLPVLSAERIREELIKVLDADPRPSTTLELYADSGALRVLYPELEALRSVAVEAERDAQMASADEPTEWTLAVATVCELPIRRPLLRLGALLGSLTPDEVVATLMRLRLSNRRIDDVASDAGAEPLPAPSGGAESFRRWLSRHGVRRLPAIARIQLASAKARRRLGLADDVEEIVSSWRRVRAVRAEAPPLEVGDLTLDGRGLIALGLKPGPAFGEILAELLEWVLEDPSRNERTTLEEKALALARGASGG